MKSLSLSARQVCDAECLLNGAFAPLSGFCTQEEYESILKGKRLPNGEVWPMPITLDINQKLVSEYSIGSTVQLHDAEGLHLANMTIESLWEPDKSKEARALYGTEDDVHPGVSYLMHQAGSVYIGGKLEKVALPHHYDYINLRYTPEQLKKHFNPNIS